MASSEERLKHFFREADTDGNGKLCISEICNIMKKAGCADSREEMERWFCEIDTNKDNMISFEEMVHAFNEKVNEDGKLEADVRFKFLEMDTEGTGLLSTTQLKLLFGANVDDGLVDSLMSQMDLNEDGKINFEEFLVYWRKTRA